MKSIELAVCVPNSVLLTLSVLHKAKTNTNLFFFSRGMTNNAMIVVEKLTNNAIATRVGEILPSLH